MRILAHASLVAGCASVLIGVLWQGPVAAPQDRAREAFQAKLGELLRRTLAAVDSLRELESGMRRRGLVLGHEPQADLEPALREAAAYLDRLRDVIAFQPRLARPVGGNQEGLDFADRLYSIEFYRDVLRHSPNRRVRATAFLELSRLPGFEVHFPEFRNLFIADFLVSRDPETQLHLAVASRTVPPGDDVRGALISYVRSSREDRVREYALNSLQNYTGDEVVRDIIVAARFDPAARVRKEAESLARSFGE